MYQPVQYSLQHTTEKYALKDRVFRFCGYGDSVGIPEWVCGLNMKSYPHGSPVAVIRCNVHAQSLLGLAVDLLHCRQQAVHVVSLLGI